MELRGNFVLFEHFASLLPVVFSTLLELELLQRTLRNNQLLRRTHRHPTTPTTADRSADRYHDVVSGHL